MAVSNCAFNSAAALRRVFIPSSLDKSSCLHVTRILVPAFLPPAHQQARAYSRWGSPQAKSQAGTWASPDLGRLANNTRPAAHEGSFQKQSKLPPRNLDKPGPRVKTKLARLPRDDEIRERYVHIKQVDSDGVERLSGLLEVRHLLTKLDRKSQSLEVQYMPDPKDPDSPQWPVAKIVNKKEELARKQKEKEQQKKQAAANKEKELEFNWALAPHDVEHKLRTLQKFLAKGYKVQLLLLKKAGKGAKATKKEAETLLEKIVEAIAEVPGSKEWKGREGQLLGSMRVFIQGMLQAQEKGDATAKDKKSRKGMEDQTAEQSE